uniref:Uncharacterized protein n=1 Tax=Populus trichocarpa TaxID=3694 RepID=A0A2K1Z5I6_POPTR
MGNVYGVGSSEEGAWVSSEDPPPTVALAAAAVVVVVVSCIRVAAAADVIVSSQKGTEFDRGSVVACMYRQMRRKEQDRLARMDADYQRRKEMAEFTMRREERMKAAEEHTVKSV